MGREKEQAKRSAKLIAGLAAFAIATTCLAPSGTPTAPSEAKAYTQVEQIVNSGHGYIDPQYLCVHETANPGATEWNHVSLWSRGWPYACHYVAGLNGQTVVHTMADDRKSWSVGYGNSKVVSIELCHATNRADFNKQWDEAVKWCGDYLNKRGWGIDRLISHNDARMRFGGTDHTDPLSYFSSYGKSWDQFKAEVAAYMKTGQTGGTVEQGGAQQSTASSNSMGVYTSTASALNVRSGAGTGYRVVRTYPKGTRFDLYEVKNGWGRTPSGWICLQYTTYGGGNATATTASSAGTYRVTASALHVRYGAGTGYSKVPYRNLTANAKAHAYGNGCLKNGTRVTVLQTSGNWARIPSGWVCMDYLARA